MHGTSTDEKKTSAKFIPDEDVGIAVPAGALFCPLAGVWRMGFLIGKLVSQQARGCSAYALYDRCVRQIGWNCTPRNEKLIFPWEFSITGSTCAPVRVTFRVTSFALSASSTRPFVSWMKQSIYSDPWDCVRREVSWTWVDRFSFFVFCLAWPSVLGNCLITWSDIYLDLWRIFVSCFVQSFDSEFKFRNANFTNFEYFTNFKF